MKIKIDITYEGDFAVPDELELLLRDIMGAVRKPSIKLMKFNIASLGTS